MLQDKSRFPRISFHRLNKLIGRSTNRIFQKHGLSITNEQEIILRNLRKADQVTQTELAAVTGQDKFNTSRTVSILEKKGLIRKETDLNDQRSCRISITPEGVEMHQKVWDVLEKWREQVFEGIEPQRLEEYAEVTSLLLANAKAMLDQDE